MPESGSKPDLSPVELQRENQELKILLEKCREDLQKAAGGALKFQYLFRTSADGVIMIDSDTLKIIDVNKACENIYGYTKKEFLKLTLLDLSNEPEKSRGTVQPILDGELLKIPKRLHKKKRRIDFSH